jgi:hypothetical protein
MPALYPTDVKTFQPKVDNVSPVIAADVNLAYLEISAIENVIGRSPTTITGWSGTFDQSTTVWSTVAARIANIEKGLNAAFNDRVRSTGGSTIASSSATVGLTISTSGSGNLLVAGSTTIDSSGNIVLIDGGTA